MNNAFDITAKKHGGVNTSVAAHKRLLPTKEQSREQVYNQLAQMRNATAREIADALGWEINRVSGRLTELIAFRRVEKTKAIRGNGRVLRTTTIQDCRVCGHSDSNHNAEGVCMGHQCLCFGFEIGRVR